MNRFFLALREVAWLPVFALLFAGVAVGISLFLGNIGLSVSLGLLAVVCAILSFRE